MNKDASRLEVVQVILENFESIDEDGSGSISPEELTAGMALANVDRTIVKAIIKALDADGNGEIEKIELIDEERRLQNILDANDPMRKKMSVSALKKKKTGARRTRRGSVVGHSGGGRASSRSMSPPPIDPRKVGAPLPPGSATADKRTNPAGSPNAVKARKRRVRRLSILAGIDSSGDRYSMIRAIMDNFGSVSGESGGGLSKDQLRLCLPPETSADEADKLFREIDKDGSGSIEFFELQAELARLKGTGDTTGASTKKLSTFQKMQLAAQKKATSVADPDATMPADWDAEKDGEWEAPMVPNVEHPLADNTAIATQLHRLLKAFGRSAPTQVCSMQAHSTPLLATETPEAASEAPSPLSKLTRMVMPLRSRRSPRCWAASSPWGTRETSSGPFYTSTFDAADADRDT